MSDAGPRAFRWRLAGDAPPPLTSAYRVGLGARAAIYRGAESRGLTPLPDSFHKTDDETHSHAFWFAQDEDGDGRIDHVLLFAASGIPWTLLPVLADRVQLALSDLGRWRLMPDWMGDRAPGALFGPARRWLSVTAYVTPLARERKKRSGEIFHLGPEEQLRWEIGERKLAGARLTQFVRLPAIMRGNGFLLPQEFTLAARRLSSLPRNAAAPRHWRPPQDAELLAAEITFAQPVAGPFAFGFGAHFGLGLFEAAD